MAFIDEADIEKATIQLFTESLGYKHYNCQHYDHLQRDSQKSVFAAKHLRAALQRLNPDLDAPLLEKAAFQLLQTRLHTELYTANYDFYQLLKQGIEVKTLNKQGREVLKTVKILDFNEPTQNEFLIVSQLWIMGTSGSRRPDILLYINGLPLIFIELKRSDKPLENAYNDNLLRYRDVIPQLFVPNVACILSNGSEAKIGAYNASFKFFKDWYRAAEPKDAPDQWNKPQVQAQKAGLAQLVRSFCNPNTLIDFIENFVLYEKDHHRKIIAQNHQYLGVNNALQAYQSKEGTTQIGTFWHTQGSGKSYSMVFFTEKLRRKYEGDFTFLLITDRLDLDRQLHDNYVQTGILTHEKNAEKVRPENSKELRAFLQANKRYIFTLIHKFKMEKGKAYPVLSRRKDIIVLADEAHRTQYNDLADNMRNALPNARYLAFTGTPLLETGITEKYFGAVISEYNFAQSIEDQSTVPLYYNSRIPHVQLVNDALQEEFEAIVSSEDLTEEQIMQLERKYSREYEVLKRDDRLETIAQDIVQHFPNRGYLGKGMVICIDKFTAVRMYDKVTYHWKEYIKRLQRDTRSVKNVAEKRDLLQKIKWMTQTQMAVVISSEDAEIEKFNRKGLNIKPHRDRMNELDAQGKTIEAHFKAEEHPLRLVFVCAMWLTGFDVKSISTLYLDKPMQNHSLMQAIARANRVCDYTVNGISKLNGEIIAYYGIFESLKAALAVYAQGSPTNGVQTEAILQPFDVLKTLLKTAMEQGIAWGKTIGFDLGTVLKASNVLERNDILDDFADKVLAKEEYKKKFIVYQNTISNLYAACRPDASVIQNYQQIVSIFEHLRNVMDRKNQTGHLDDADLKIGNLLDNSVLAESETEYKISKTWQIDLSKLNYESLREAFRTKVHKNIALADIRIFIEGKIRQMMAQNPSRVSFLERYERLIQGYNESRWTTERFGDELNGLVESLETEAVRHIQEDLTERELVFFDLLEKANSSNEDKKQVKIAVKALLKRLSEQKISLLGNDWYKSNQTRVQVETLIRTVLDEQLPESYDMKWFEAKQQRVFDYILENT